MLAHVSTDAAGLPSLCVHVPAVVPDVTGPAVAPYIDLGLFRALLGSLVLLRVVEAVACWLLDRCACFVSAVLPFCRMRGLERF